MARFPWRSSPAAPSGSDLAAAAVAVATRPEAISEQPAALRPEVAKLAEAVKAGAAWSPGGGTRVPPRAIQASAVAARAAASLEPSSNVTPAQIEAALRSQGIDFVEPFAPGTPLKPFYGYDRRPRTYDYRVGRNISTETRPDRIPFATLKQVFEGYDVAQTCARHIINDLRSMKLDFGPMRGWEGDVTKEVAEARRFLRRPDGKRPFVTWLAAWMMDVLRYDAGCLWRQRDRGGRVSGLKVVDGTTIAPVLDYYGDVPEPPAPAYQQFIQGIPWDWLSTEDIIYQPQWPVPESPYGVAPIETVLLNANTDVRLQMFFLEFFTSGSVPEMLLSAPEDMSDPDSLAEWQETWDDWYQANQAGRHGARWIPHGAEPFQYKQIHQIDPRIAEYVMRRTIAAFGLMPQDLGIVQDVNRSTSETQVDSQFRINTLPNTEYYEAILDSVLQDDLGLPVCTNFDTGREREDRLMEARAHQIYVSIGAESPDEVRDAVLGLEVDNDNRVPRLFDSRRLGPIPLEYLYAVSGRVDPITLSPEEGSVTPQVYVAPSGPQGVKPTELGEPATPDHVNPKPRSGRSEETPSAKAASVADAVADLRRWRSNARARVAKGRSPRAFTDSAIPEAIYDLVWADLRRASTREQVDAAFAKASDAGPKAAAPVPGAT